MVFEFDDPDCLARTGFITYDDDPGGDGGRRYWLTRAGAAYAEQTAGKSGRG